MLIAAKAAAGAEFMYSTKSAHKVSKASGQRIVDALNRIGFDLKPGEVWHLYNVSEYDNAYYIAESQQFKVYKGSIRRYA